MLGFWSLIWAVIFSLVMLVPLVLCLVYVIISLRQWAIGEHEKSAFKKKGALISLAISFAALLLVILGWWYVIDNF
jgi:heme/copper-type cytochrome/quinol oxidase subunit 2